jgi:hypothetical protein
MKTIFIKKVKSGNYKITNENDFTEKLSNENEIENFFSRIQNESTNTYDRFYGRMKKAKLIKASYSQSQTYFSDAKELIKFNK